MKYDAIKQNKKIREALIKRFEELNLTQADIVEDANKRNYKGINRPKLSVYLSGKQSKDTLSSTHIFWLCYRYCIDVKIDVLLTPYNEKKANAYLEMFKKYA